MVITITRNKTFTATDKTLTGEEKKPPKKQKQ